jgi:alkylation response protein AidB-like acyl-CoA dehydrogenase
MTEPGSGSDAYSLRTTATRCDGGYMLNGTKTLVTNAPLADLAVVFATTNPGLGRWGITAFLVERGQSGFRAGPDMQKMGLRSAPIGELVFDDCFVSERNRLGPEGAGVNVFGSSMNLERSCILASHVGAMERQLEACVDYAKTRSQFGHPIGKFQSVANRIADMKVRLETARLVLYRAAWLNTTGQETELDASIAKLYVSECFVRSSEDAIRVHGGYGYLTESGIERNLRDALGGTLYSGTSDIQRVIIAGWLGL